MPLKTTLEDRTLDFALEREEGDLEGVFPVFTLEPDAAFPTVFALFEFFVLAAISLRYHPASGAAGQASKREAGKMGPFGPELHQIKNIKQSNWKESLSWIRTESAAL